MITNFKGELGYTLCSSINEMQFLEKLHINALGYNEVIDFNFKSTQSALRKLCLRGKLKKLPNWIPRLENLLNLSLMYSELTNDPLESIKDMPNLLFLVIKTRANVGERLHFLNGGFQKLKELQLEGLDNLKFICIDRGELHS